MSSARAWTFTFLATSVRAPASSDVKFVRGDLGSVSGYPIDVVGDLSRATSLTDTDNPAAGAGFYYLLRPAGTCRVGSWQSVLGAEPGRDAALP